jgi:hypothetical protein
MFARRERRKTAFRPTFQREGGALESRQLMAVRPFAGGPGTLPPPAVRRNYVLPPTANHHTKEGLPMFARNYVQTGIGNGGRAAVMVDVDGELWAAHVSGGGTVRAKAVAGGLVDLFVYGTNPSSILTIDPEAPVQEKGGAHEFATGTALQDGLLHVRNITVANGQISEIAGYRTADVSGRILVDSGRIGPSVGVSRIAMYNLLPGASINVAGDLDTLDIYNTIYLNGGPGIQVGRDLNWFNTGQDLILANGASILVGRDIGLIAQEAKGTGEGGQGGKIQGNLIVGPGSTILPERFMASTLLVQGSLAGVENLPAKVLSSTIVFGSVS